MRMRGFGIGRFREPNPFVENGNLSCFVRFGEPTPFLTKTHRP
jgi:hypothetical protein